MKPSNIWFALILVASASLPSGAKSLALEPSPRDPASQRETSNSVQTNTQQYSPSPQPIAASSTPAPNKTEEPAAIATRDKEQTVRVILPEIEVHKSFADYAYIVFSFLLVLVGAAQVALFRKAFRIERPYLYVVRVEGAYLTPAVEGDLDDAIKPTISLAKVTIKNAGKGPAVNLAIVARLTISIDPKNPLPLPPDVSVGWPVEVIEDHVIGPDRTSRFMVFWEGSWQDPQNGRRISQQTHIALMHKLGNLVAYGVIKYEDTLGNSYESIFGNIWVPAGVNMGRPGNFYRGPNDWQKIK
jgi:hypothetical protein